MDPITAEQPKPHPAKVPEPRVDAKTAEKMYGAGIDFYRKGQYDDALDVFTEARRANPSYSPAWYGLGIVNEALGHKGAAKAAYQRYLQLAPNAANADQIRFRITRL